jgi:hypothetical protein
MRIEFTLTDDDGNSYAGSATLSQQPRPEQRQAARQDTQPKPNNLPEHILHLRDHGFFKQARTGNEVYSAVQEKYPCQIDRVQMALLRLQRKRSLRKTSKVVDKREQVAYVW